MSNLPIRFLLFFSTFILVTSLGALYIYHRHFLTNRFLSPHRIAFGILLIIFILIYFTSIISYRTHSLNINDEQFKILLTISYVGFGFLAICGFYTIAMDILFLISTKLAKDDVDLARRALFTDGIKLGVLGLASASTGIGIYQAKHDLEIVKVEVPIKDLPQDLDGLTIAQISDLHVGPTIKKDYVEKVVQMTNELNADFIALTGDFVDGTIEQLHKDIEPLRMLKSSMGTYFCTGNHEYYSGAVEWTDHLTTLGIKSLNNEHVILKKQNTDFILAGVYDYKAHTMIPNHKSDATKAVHGAPENAFKILLAHQPKSYLDADAAGINLQLSGHTHGGQFFPVTLLIHFFHKYSRGLYQHSEKLWVYVNRGTGYWGPPVRFMLPPEISLIKLKKMT